MRAILKLFIAIETILLLFAYPSIPAPWIPHRPFQPITREKIIKNAKEMVEFSWSPLNNIRNFSFVQNKKNVYKDYSNGVAYSGIPYLERDKGPTYDWAGFYNQVIIATPSPNTQDSAYWKYWGNDCSRGSKGP